MIYDRADEAIRILNRLNLRLFGRLKLIPADELNIIRETKDAYGTSARHAKRRYLEVAQGAYVEACVEAGMERSRAWRLMREDIVEAWLMGVLDEVDPVTRYRFDPETERKQARLAESLALTTFRDREVDKALRYWTLQTAQYAISVTDRARLEGFMAAGVAEVKWNTKQDERACEECRERDQQIYPIDKVPPKPHFGCRCWLTPA